MWRLHSAMGYEKKFGNVSESVICLTQTVVQFNWTKINIRTGTTVHLVINWNVTVTDTFVFSTSYNTGK